MTTQTTVLPRNALAAPSSAANSFDLPSARQVRVQPVRSRQDLAEFIDLPKRLYAADAQWVAPLDMQVKQFLNTNHPFYQHGEAEAFVARRNGQPVGRIVVSDDSRYNRAHGSSVG